MPNRLNWPNIWYQRDFLIKKCTNSGPIQVKVLRGPRQVGKTSLIESLATHQSIIFDDHILRSQAQENPSFFLDQFTAPLLLDEASLVPPLFLEIKKRVDEAKRDLRLGKTITPIDYWITGPNQTLLSKYVQESLAGRADFFILNTLSIHEMGETNLSNLLMRGGWPELQANKAIDPTRYLNNLITTFIEKDIVQAAQIEKKAAFTKTLQLLAGQIGELLNYSEIARATGVESTTIQSWTLVLEQNHLIKIVLPYMNTINKRLIKTPKIYFEDVALAVRFQGWTEYGPLMVSPYYGHLIENLVYSELSRFFTNNLIEPKIYFLRTKEKVEIDFLIELPNKKFIAIEVKTTPQDFTGQQLQLLDSLKINLIKKLIVSPKSSMSFKNAEVVAIDQLYTLLLDQLTMNF